MRTLRSLCGVLVIATLLLGIVPLNSTHAATLAPTVITFTAADAAAGVTAKSTDGTLAVGFAAGVLTGTSTVTLTPAIVLPVALTTRYRAATPAWTIAVDPPITASVPVTLSVPNANLYRKLLLTPTAGGTGWERIPGAQWSATSFTATLAPRPTTILGVDDTKVLQGIASWYRSVRYPYGVASNDFPLGTRLRVTNLDNSKLVVVTVVSTGPFVPGRVVDLSYTAYTRIATGGLARVQVERAGSGSTATAFAVDPDFDAGGTPTTDGSTPPAAAAASVVVVDQGSGVQLYGRSADTARPIASITKLLSTAVFLDTNPNLDRVVAYRSEDNAIGAKLYLSPGETATLRDYLATALVGSANNAVKVLARSTGLTTAQFVARMNTTAKDWGMSSSHFTDPTGLDPGNVASAKDVATLTEHVFSQYPLVRTYTLKLQYAFRTADRGILHTIKATDILLAQSSLTLTGGKTGYLDEALYTMVLRARDAAGHQVLAVVLGSPTSTARFAAANDLLTWALKHTTWSA